MGDAKETVHHHETWWRELKGRKEYSSGFPCLDCSSSMLQPLYNSYLRSLKPDILRLSSWRGDGYNRVAHMQSADETFKTSCPLCLFLWRSWGYLCSPWTLPTTHQTWMWSILKRQLWIYGKYRGRKKNSKKQHRPVLSLVWNMGEHTELLCLASWVCKSQRIQTAEKTEVCVNIGYFNIAQKKLQLSQCEMHLLYNI